MFRSGSYYSFIFNSGLIDLWIDRAMTSDAQNVAGVSKGGPFGTILWEVDKDSISEWSTHSDSIEVEGMQWAICADRDGDEGDDEYLEVYLELLILNPDVHGADMSLELKLINHDDDTKSIIGKSFQSIKEDVKWGNPQFVRWNKAIAMNENFIKNKKITLQARFCLSNIRRIGSVANFAPSLVGSSTESPTYGIIRWEFSKEFMSNEEFYSRAINVGGMQWRIHIDGSDENEYLSVYLYLEDGDYKMMSVDVTREFKLINHNDESETITMKRRVLYTKNRNDLGYSQFARWSEAIDQEQGFIKDNKLTLLVEFSLSNFEGSRDLGDSLSLCHPNIAYNDVVLNIRSNKLYVSKQFLSIHSAVFHTMFYGDFAEKNQEKIELKDIKLWVFIMLHNVIISPSNKFKDKDVESLLKLGDRFDIDWLIYRCEQYLITSSNLDVAAKLVLSSRYRLTALQAHCLYQLKSIKDVADLKDSPNFNDLPYPINLVLFHKMIDLARVNDRQEPLHRLFTDLFDSNHKEKIELMLSNKFRELRRVDFSNEDEPSHDVALILDGEKIYVSKQYLSIHSPVFSAMFFGDSAAKNKKEIELKEIDREEFIEFLHVIYPPFKQITDKNVGCLLQLGDCFNVDWVVSQCEQFFVTSTKFSVATKLVFASRFRLFVLQVHCLDQLKTINDVKKLKYSPLFHDLPEAIKVALFHKMIDLSDGSS
ncbi:hypothetical protein PENTCL1PPCAC_23755 [Pristionchus entomophagus]|uniref:BTB domain-containing protein n=1 Tax=Pristionchus entomophagus TaxID=358040 RepID=A0AAV5U517_9BILA|nr:hypothetical protein PENTCL1PPCAC_23755 [Pristionchus entomophagus]